MNCKEVISVVCLLLVSACMQAQGTYVIEGKVKNVKQGVCLNLFRMEGDVGSSIAIDTLRGDSFRFEIPVSEAGTDRLTLAIRDGNLYSMGLYLWANSDSYIRLTGEDMNIYTWRVESEVPQQKIWQLFVDDSRDLWNLKQENRMEQMRLMRKYPRKPDDADVLARVVALRDSLEKVGDNLDFRIDSNVIVRMRQLPIEEIWMVKLESLAIALKYKKGFPFRKEVEELYARLSDKQRQTPEALDIRSYLAPSDTVSIREKAADGDLFDLQGNVHHLSDFRGKAVLIDFWSRGCGPCVLALPEMKEISKLYADRLTVVSLSIDDKTNWEIASRHHDISWWNLNDLKGKHGLYAKYDAGAIPRYVFLSPEGEVVEMWTGYGKGSLKKKMEEFFDKK
ncbi:TlpA disulfide reductase family protein [Bacteroides helcogenes]|uniref:Alkyl hydroperoxide reductase/ Thiol specific antioxidant/ Mal allergen n=1 Tax=Bacteroides helcogenes (strain ATCC 35417 / DSM 20613 / JCM 6297 / CCUG 15421 / P 36-108) TaxID=693979 RepID=E6SUU7_BACT6|nr:TlpA disulfide reductase family protein [Bacteroides helcogenes]ADV44442.1 alkyl hydroperoxide reductase/ Thiol specific antioxidant/ Mal allergen [Bacteroides helcogenes P 36-108]MDY5237093.1 TlpA disulfide reductase family protein [Bacteroides helcogenes]